MRKMYKFFIIGLLAITLVLSGCVEEKVTDTGGDDTGDQDTGGDNGGATGEEMSFTTVTISDAPIDNFRHINVTFSEVKVHKSGNDNDSGWISFNMDPITIDMLYLHENNVSEVLGVANLTVGNYTQLWVVVDSATGILNETGEEIVFDVPSGDLKYKQSFEIRQGNTTIDIELDLGESVLYVPQGGVAKLLPTPGKMRIEHGRDKDKKDKEDEDELEVDANGDYEAIIGEIIEFEGTATGGVEPYNWSWDFGDGNTSYEKDPEHLYLVTGEYNITLTVTDDIGNTAIDETKAYIYNELEADAGDEYNSTFGEPVQLFGNATGGIEPYSWYWDFGDGENSTEQEPMHTYTSAGNYTATLTVTDFLGHIATDTADVEII